MKTSKLIYEIIRHIPKGKVATYGEIARLTGLIGEARRVGTALHNLPPNSSVPWHRVINAQGRISFPKNSRAYQRQKKLLEKEGIMFLRGKIDLAKYGWLR